MAILRANAGDLEGMGHACWSVYYHTISTDYAPQHDYCPIHKVLGLASVGGVSGLAQGEDKLGVIVDVIIMLGYRS